MNAAIGVRTEILNKLIDEKRTFVLMIYTNDCEGREYHIPDGAEKIFKANGIPYFYTTDAVAGYDMSLYESKIDTDRLSGVSLAIYRDGELYAALDPDVYAIKSDDETKSWLKKYLDID